MTVAAASPGRVLIPAILIVLAPCAADAQIPLNVSTHVGMYLPMGVLVEEYDPEGALAQRRRQIGSVVGGVRFALGDGFHVLEGTLNFAPAQVAVTDSKTTRDVSSQVAMAGLRVLFRIRQATPAGQFGVYVAPGVGWLKRYGAIWNDTKDTTDTALILAGGTRMKVRGVRLILGLEVEDYLTGVNLSSEGARRFHVHHDLMWSIGFTIPMGDT